MGSKEVRQTACGFTRTVPVPYEEAVHRARAVLSEEGFRVPSETYIKDRLRAEIVVDSRRCSILGACNLPLARATLQQALEIGLPLPCSVIVYEANDAAESVVSAVDARAMLGSAGRNPDLDRVADELDERLERAISRL